MTGVWIVDGLTESGDRWLMVFGYRPSDIVIEKEIRRDVWLNDEFEAGSIGSYSVTSHYVIKD